ncbi:hypothetical protein Droror1_Dr00016125 [Drosera rotundifolia]
MRRKNVSVEAKAFMEKSWDAVSVGVVDGKPSDGGDSVLFPPCRVTLRSLKLRQDSEDLVMCFVPFLHPRNYIVRLLKLSRFKLISPYKFLIWTQLGIYTYCICRIVALLSLCVFNVCGSIIILTS